MTSFVQIGDTHFGETPDFIARNANPYAAAVRLVNAINQLPQRPDFVIHTGDVVDSADETAAYRLAQTVLAELGCPVYYATGNHDRAAMLRQWMSFGEKVDLAADVLFYRFSIGDEAFLVLDGRAADVIDPAGIISAEQLNYLQSLPPAGNPLTLFIHFPALPVGSAWIDNAMLLQNGSALHRALLPLRARLRGVFHGHLHQGMHVMRDGITYTCVPSGFRQFQFWHRQGDEIADYTMAQGFNWVNCAAGQTIVRRMTIDER
jgi:3',5'-cyclic AMP phosphodiesterase CpdA